MLPSCSVFHTLWITSAGTNELPYFSCINEFKKMIIYFAIFLAWNCVGVQLISWCSAEISMSSVIAFFCTTVINVPTHHKQVINHYFKSCVILAICICFFFYVTFCCSGDILSYHGSDHYDFEWCAAAKCFPQGWFGSWL